MEKQAPKKVNFVLIASLLINVVLAYYIIDFSSENSRLSSELSKNRTDNKAMNDDLNQILNKEEAENRSNDLKENLKLLLGSYDSLETSNSMVIDSISNQREKINTLLTKVSKLNSKSKRDWREIYRLQKEAETLRGIMKDYIHTIDSLNTLNINLSNTLTEKNKKLSKVNKQNKQFKEQNKNLQEQVTAGAVLQVNNIIVTPLRIGRKGSQSETTRASKTNMIKTCFTLIENKLTKAGDKTIYIKISDENKTILPAPIKLSIRNTANEEIEVSSQRTVNYQNENTELCIFYEISSPIASGKYNIELFSDGYQIGTTSFSIR